MFCPCSKSHKDDPEREANDRIAKQLRADQREKAKAKIIKLLLLGAGDSGKSTLAKQMKILYLDGYKNAEDRKNLIPAIHQNILNTLKDIVKGATILKIKLNSEAQVHADFISALPTHQPLNPDIAERCKALKVAGELSELIKKSIDLQVYDHFEYMMQKIDEIAAEDYVPTVDDILRTRVRTTGINEITYVYNNMNFTVVDMGGQRSERKKWLFFFEGVTSVIYVLALNEYDLRLREDSKVNRMHESLNLFKNVINNQFLKDTAIILFLNKMDLFEEKITRVDLKVCFPEYKGEQKSDQAIKFIDETFRSFDMNPKRSIFVHTTCATDTTKIEKVLADVKLTLIHKVLQDIGIL